MFRGLKIANYSYKLNYFTYIYMSIIFNKGVHTLVVVDNGTKARIKGLHGFIDSIELITLLTLNGYQVINQ